MLEYSKARKQWEIRSIFNDTLMAFTNETTDFPEGMHSWYFVSNCKDEADPWRILKIHRFVKLPGYFCCDDGHCIKSDLEFFDTFITFHQTPSNFYRILELTYTQM